MFEVVYLEDNETCGQTGRRKEPKSKTEKIAEKEIHDLLAMKRITISPINCGQSMSRAPHMHIIGGETTRAGDYPWIVSVVRNDKHDCGASIITNNWLLSAAHCFDENDEKNIYVRIGSDYSINGTKYELSRIIRHPMFTESTYFGDISLLKTRKPIQFSEDVQPICLPPITYYEPKNARLTVAGWGHTAFKSKITPLRMRQVTLDVIDPVECIDRYKTEEDISVFKSQICTWNKGKDSCQGDSGGPLMDTVNGRTYLVGIVSSGMTCADEFPGMFTKVSFFLQWIKETIDKNS